MISDKELNIIFESNKKNTKVFKKIFRYFVLFASLFFFFYVVLNYAAFYKKITFIPTDVKINALNASPKVETVNEKPKPTARIYIENLPNNSLSIPVLNITAPIAWETPLDDIYIKLEQGTVHLDGTALPDEIGNIFVFGHSSNYSWAPGSYNQVFVNLPNIQIDNDIVVNYNNQQFLYRVKRTLVVNPSNIDVIKPTEKPTLTLMTCVPIGTAINRLIVQAELVEGLIYNDPEHQNLDLNYLPKVI